MWKRGYFEKNDDLSLIKIIFNKHKGDANDMFVRCRKF